MKYVEDYTPELHVESNVNADLEYLNKEEIPFNILEAAEVDKKRQDEVIENTKNLTNTLNTETAERSADNKSKVSRKGSKENSKLGDIPEDPLTNRDLEPSKGTSKGMKSKEGSVDPEGNSQAPEGENTVSSGDKLA